MNNFHFWYLEFASITTKISLPPGNGLQKSMCTTSRGFAGKFDICNDSGVIALLFAWHGKHLSIIFLLIFSMFGNHTFFLSNCFVLTIPWWPS